MDNDSFIRIGVSWRYLISIPFRFGAESGFPLKISGRFTKIPSCRRWVAVGREPGGWRAPTGGGDQVSCPAAKPHE